MLRMVGNFPKDNTVAPTPLDVLAKREDAIEIVRLHIDSNLLQGRPCVDYQTNTDRSQEEAMLISAARAAPLATFPTPKAIS